jgi:hypothetical protein
MTNQEAGAALPIEDTMREKIARIEKWLDRGCNSWLAPAQDIRSLLALIEPVMEENEQLVADALETARQRAVVLFNAYALGVSMKHGRSQEQFTHDVSTFSDELADALRVPISRAALSPKSEKQDAQG